VKALVLHQPWASLMAAGLKRNETRSRPWRYDGDFAVCASATRWRTSVPDGAAKALLTLWEHRQLFDGWESAKDVRELYGLLPFGAVVCVVRKVGCFPTESVALAHLRNGSRELNLGDYSPGRWYYPTTDLRKLARPVGVRGRQFVFDLDPGTAGAVRRQLVNP